MAAVNSVQSGGLRLPLTGLAPPRVLMCSASMGAEGSVTLQLREAVQAPDAAAPLDAALTIGYPDPEILADMLGTLGNLQAAATNTNSSGGGSSSKNNNETSTSNGSNANAMSVKKARPKTASPTRHGPQQCQVCSKVFGNASALAKHKLTHSDERKYVCGMCSKAFKRQDHLNGHMLTHRNKKPYECKAEGCGKSYCDARSLRRHTENHHSSLAMTPTTPHSSLSSSTGPPTGLSLSPATASGDASSPHGATCIPFSSANDNISSKPSSPSSPAGVGNEGLTRQQLDLISQIMQQTKQANAGLTASAGQRQTTRPRTWNMQTQLQQTQSKLSPNPENAANSISSSSPPVGPNVPKLEQKPVECNLCHRKFKNIPALNGHMRLHGGYFKKDAETKKCDKKETPGPPLQTASVGVRALIEEKIISKRSKDLKGAFVVPAPPLAARRLSDTETFLSPKLPSSTTSTVTLPTLCQSTTTLATALQIATSVASTVAGKSSKTDAIIKSSPVVDSKDATLIELLKRGTKVAVKRTSSDPGTAPPLLQESGSSKATKSSPVTPTTTPPLALSIGNSESAPLALTISQEAPGASDVFTLAYSTDSSSGFFHDNEVYSVNDTAMLLQAVDSIQLLHESSANAEQIDEISALGDYSLTENTALAGNFASSRQLQAVLNSPLPESLAEFSALHSKDYILYGNSPSAVTQSSSSPLPSPLAYPTPPASHEAVAQASPFLDDSHHFADVGPFFGDEKKSTSFLEDVSKELSDNERILQLKNELFSDSKSVLDEKTGDIFKEDPDGDRLRDLAFLDEPDSFLEDTQNPSSPLSAAFFSATMSSAEEVKEALQEVLPNENLTEDTAPEADDIDLYYLPMCNLQSQMMPNSDDPLLSSSPKDFISRPHKFEFGFCPPAKRTKGNSGEESMQPTATPLTVQTEQPLPPKDSEVFLSPSSISSTSTPSPKIIPIASLMSRKRHHTEHYARVYERFRSRLRSGNDHFTPSPILNPSRNATGIYFCLVKDGLQEEDDCLMSVSDDLECLLDSPRINIGSDFQAQVPDFMVKEEDVKVEEEDTQLWDPVVGSDERQLRRYIELSKSSAVPLGSHSEEIALKTLLDTHGQVHTAILELLQSPATAIHKRWTPQEIKLFLKGLETFRKDFYRISKEIPHKSTGDCIQLYYFWKKLCVDYKLTHLQQNNQRRISHELNNNAPLVYGTDSHHTSSTLSHSTHTDIRPHICEMPDCSASFSSKAALHGHTKLHCMGRSVTVSSSASSSSSSSSSSIKDDFPCKVCGKVFNKVKSRSAHMKSHRPQDSDSSMV
ncbi:uncharacterized protein LOC132258096 isoform X2 [Phlebotomus argentipes]|uniref:uncharacterized protein LOC132258096 isoform X2 n=1 Tax=Phlebotomus argentipes TaxID=94469 RepID=UPI002892CB12|nr:uncharacterized protein LOC132258096 isoform X2 [Phlebotomus argentipes]